MTEVSNWVRQYVAPKDIPSGTNLRASVPSLDDNQATAMLGILERASMKTPSQRRGALPIDTLAMTPVPVLRSGSNHTTRIALAVAAAALLVAGVSVAKVAKTETQPPVREVHVVAPQATQLADTRIAPAAAPMKEETVVEKTVENAATTRTEKTATPAVRSVIAKAPSPRTVVAAPAKASDTCRVPYTIDAAGQKHYKVECM